MAQLSKKDQIANTALSLFLEHGIKGTSVDMVVRTSSVSKPTVYNHFSDKAMLLAHVVRCWLNSQAGPKIRARTVNGLVKELHENWLTDDALRLYGLFLGEGFRAPDAKALFKNQFDDPWREALGDWAQTHKQDALRLNALVDSKIVQSLF